MLLYFQRAIIFYDCPLEDKEEGLAQFHSAWSLHLPPISSFSLSLSLVLVLVSPSSRSSCDVCYPSSSSVRGLIITSSSHSNHPFTLIMFWSCLVFIMSFWAACCAAIIFMPWSAYQTAMSLILTFLDDLSSILLVILCVPQQCLYLRITSFLDSCSLSCSHLIYKFFTIPPSHLHYS